MATLSQDVISRKSYILAAWGEAPWSDGTGHLVIEPKVQEYKNSKPNTLDANLFDLGALRSSFHTHAMAQDHLEKILSGDLKIKEFRKINPDEIKIREMVYEARRVQFSDEEHEVMAILGAVDSLDYNTKPIIKAAFPELFDTPIRLLGVPPYQTNNGDPSSFSFECYVSTNPKMVDYFNSIATGGNEGLSAENIHYTMKPQGGYFRTSLQSVVEEIGKSRLNVTNEVGLSTELLFVRLYDFNDTYKPEPTAPDIKTRALTAIVESPTEIRNTLLEALQRRGLLPTKPSAGLAPIPSAM